MKKAQILHSLAVGTALAVGLCSGASLAATTLDPQNPGNFTRDGQQSFTPGNVLRLTDTSSGDFIAFFANDADAGPGVEVDVIATFQIIQAVPNNADAGARVVINDGVARSAIAACVVINSVRGIGLFSTGPAWDPASYPVFVPVDWQNVTTIRLRRTATGDAEIVEVNGVAPAAPACLPASLCPAKTRAGATVEFGAASLEAECTVEYAAFRSEPTATSVEDLGPNDGGIPGQTALLPPFPNPSPGTTQLSFRLTHLGSVQLEIFDIAGRRVRSLLQGHLPAGLHSVAWDGRTDDGSAVGSGLYFVKFSSPHGRASSRVTLVR